MLPKETIELISQFETQFHIEHPADHAVSNAYDEMRSPMFAPMVTIKDYRRFIELLTRYAKKKGDFLFERLRRVVSETVPEPDEALAQDLQYQFKLHMESTIHFIEREVSRFRFIHGLPEGHVDDCINRLHGITSSYTPEITLYATEFRNAMNKMKSNAHGPITITGDNARVNIHSTDNSTNTVNSDTLFREMRKAIKSQVESETKQVELLAAVNDMESSKGKPEFLPAYQNFIAAAANHVTVFAPFLAPLAKMLSGG